MDPAVIHFNMCATLWVLHYAVRNTKDPTKNTRQFWLEKFVEENVQRYRESFHIYTNRESETPMANGGKEQEQPPFFNRRLISATTTPLRVNSLHLIVQH